MMELRQKDLSRSRFTFKRRLSSPISSTTLSNSLKRFAASSIISVTSMEETKYKPRGQETKLIIIVLPCTSFQLSAKMEQPVTAQHALNSVTYP